MKEFIRRKKKQGTAMLAGALGLLLALTLTVALAPMPAVAVQQLSHRFMGNATVQPCGTAVQEGARILALMWDPNVGDWVDYGYSEVTGVPVIPQVDENGQYGYDPTFIVWGDDQATPDVKEGGNTGETIYFQIEGTDALGNPVTLPAGTAVFQSGWLGVGPDMDPLDLVVQDEADPFGTIEINDGDACTDNRNVTLSLTWDDGSLGCGVVSMRFKNETGNWSEWEDVAATKAWTLTEVDGVKTVYVEFLDGADNNSNSIGSISDSINLDTADPTGTISINSGAACTNNRNVTLTLTSSDGAGCGVVSMHFSNDPGTWTDWEDVAGTKAWTLTAGDGVKTVYVEFLDGAGNNSNSGPTISDNITLDTADPTGTISINGGAATTSSRNVTLTLTSGDDAGCGVVSMRFSNDNVDWSDPWKPVAGTAPWTLTAGDGVKTVYVEFLDGAGNNSNSGPTISDNITLDTADPTGTISINGGAATTSSRNVTLTLTSGDGAGCGVVSMRFSNDNIDWSDPWKPVAGTAPWTLTEGDGVKTVYVEFLDAAGNNSNSGPTISDDIKLDTTDPTGTISINGGAATTSSRDVTLTLTSGDGAGCGVVSMRFSNDNIDWSDSWKPVAGTAPWTLTAGDGVKTVYVEFLDGAGNNSNSIGPISDDIELSTVDTTDPTGTISINGGAACTNSRDVTLTMTWDDFGGSGVVSMHFSNDNIDWSDPWKPVAGTAPWTLTAGDGVKTVYVEFLDGAGNNSNSGPTISDNIKLDTTDPTGTISINGGAACTNNRNVTLTLTSGDGAGCGVVSMHFSNDNIDWSDPWKPVAGTAPWTLTAGDGVKTVYVEFLDAAGNNSNSIGPISDNIKLDTTDPTGTISINGGAATTSSRNVTLTLTSGDGAGCGVVSMCFSNDNATWSDWEDVAPTKAWTLTAGDGVKTVYVEFLDAAGNNSNSGPTISDDIELSTVPGVLRQVVLDTGWNTFSVPIDVGPNNTLGYLMDLAGINPVNDVEVAYYFNGQTQQFVVAQANYVMLPCDAILIKMKKAGEVPIYPNPGTTVSAKNVYTDWNLVGSAFINEADKMAVNAALITLYYAEGGVWGYSQVISPSYHQPDWVYTRQTEDAPPGPDMLMGKGYWVTMENDDTYLGQTTTPYVP